ncbi:MAG TPA: hypothetical protein VHV55_26250 [Pirellulales bacterium]|jgi:hypothetical protein|nr:hypothetical protein [Pirellulales bacterium]
MSADEEAIKRRYREFLDLLPMTVAIAGLTENPGPRSFSAEQMEARAQVLSSAFKLARQAVREIISKSSQA